MRVPKQLKYLPLDAMAPRPAARIGSQLEQTLAPAAEIPGVINVRVKGAIGVVQLSGSMHLNWMRAKLLEKGVWVRPFRDIVYLTPALNIETEDLAYLAESVLKVVEEWSTLP